MKFGIEAARMQAALGCLRHVVFISLLHLSLSVARKVHMPQSSSQFVFLGVKQAEEHRSVELRGEQSRARIQVFVSSQAVNASTSNLTSVNLTVANPTAAVNQTPAVQAAHANHSDALESHAAAQQAVREASAAVNSTRAAVHSTNITLQAARDAAAAIINGSQPNITANASNVSNVSYAHHTNATGVGIWPIEQPDPASGYGQMTTTTLPVPRCPETRTVYVNGPCNGTNGTNGTAIVNQESSSPQQQQQGEQTQEGKGVGQNMSNQPNRSQPTGNLGNISQPNTQVAVSPGDLTYASPSPAAATSTYVDPTTGVVVTTYVDPATGAVVTVTATPTTTTNQFEALSRHASAAAAQALDAAARAAAGEPSAEAVQAQAAAQRAVEIAENSKSISAQAYAVAAGMRGSVETLRADLAAAASARAGELENVRVGKPTLPSAPMAQSSMEPQGSEMAMAT